MIKGVIREQVVKRVRRSKDWPAVRKVKLDLNPECESCGKPRWKWLLQVHHIKPFRLYPNLELVITNLVTLCFRCHFTIGHRNNWKAWQPSLREILDLIRRSGATDLPNK